MLLALDIGNSEVTIGVWSHEAWAYHWRIASLPDQPEFFYGIKIHDFFLEVSIPVDAVKTIVMSSVVPGLTEKMVSVVKALFHKEPILLGPSIYKNLPIEILNPHEIGSDLVANAMAAYVKYKRACIVVDFGTALTFLTISAEGKILGVSIAPGLKTAIKALSQNTAKLFEVPLTMPASSLGKSTVTAIQSGILLGYEGLVKNVVEKIRKELNEDCLVIATGGLSSIITPLQNFFYVIDPKHTLDGLRFIAEYK
jgi:type III pantothenate kinase